jgi:hypothetical protein
VVLLCVFEDAGNTSGEGESGLLLRLDRDAGGAAAARKRDEVQRLAAKCISVVAVGADDQRGHGV